MLRITNLVINGRIKDGNRKIKTDLLADKQTNKQTKLSTYTHTHTHTHTHTLPDLRNVYFKLENFRLRQL